MTEPRAERPGRSSKSCSDFAFCQAKKIVLSDAALTVGGNVSTPVESADRDVILVHTTKGFRGQAAREQSFQQHRSLGQRSAVRLAVPSLQLGREALDGGGRLLQRFGAGYAYP